MITRLRTLVVCLAASLGCFAGSFTLTLEPGWNLVSLPIEPDDPDPDTVFRGVHLGPIWCYDQLTWRVARRIRAGRGYEILILNLGHPLTTTRLFLTISPPWWPEFVQPPGA